MTTLLRSCASVQGSSPCRIALQVRANDWHSQATPNRRCGSKDSRQDSAESCVTARLNVTVTCRIVKTNVPDANVVRGRTTNSRARTASAPFVVHVPKSHRVRVMAAYASRETRSWAIFDVVPARCARTTVPSFVRARAISGATSPTRAAIASAAVAIRCSRHARPTNHNERRR